MAQDSAIRLLTSFRGSANIASLHPDLIEGLVALRTAVAHGAWSDARRFAVRSLGVGGASAQLGVLEARSTASHADARREHATGLDELLAAVSEAPPEVRSDFAANVRGQFEGAVPTELNDALDLLERGAPIPGSPLASAASRLPVPVLGGVRMTLEMALAAAANGLLGLIHSNLNLTLAASDDAGELTLDVVGAVRLFRERFGTELSQKQASLQQAIAQDAAGSGVDVAARALTGFVEEHAQGLGRIQAWSYRTMRALQDAGKNGLSEQLGRQAATLGALTREAIASHVAARRVVAELALPTTADDVLNAVRGAGRLPFHTAIPNGTDVELSKLPQTPDGTFVEVSGSVASVSASRDSDSKLISRVDLVDPSSGATATVAAIFTHLAHTGVTPGSYLRASGVFRSSSALLDGEPGVEIDRLSIAALAERSWRIAFLRCADRWYEAWRNGTNARWSLGPSQLAFEGTEVDESASKFGAGELIYPPFVRDE